MDIRQLGAFLEVARELNFTRAAQNLHTAQSAVSATIRGLEAELGVALFDRSARQIELTGSGIALVPRAHDVLDAVRAARDAVDEVAGGVTGSISVGFMTSVTLVDTARLLGEYSRAYPRVGIRLRASERGTAGLADMLRGGELDIAFLASGPRHGAGLRVTKLASSPLLLAVAPTHHLAARQHVPMDALAGERFIDFPEGFGNRRTVDDAFAAAGITRDVRFETADIADAANLVRNGLGVAFLPEFLLAPLDDIRCIQVDGVGLELSVAVAVAQGRQPSAAAQRLWRLAVQDAGIPGRDQAGISDIT